MLAVTHVAIIFQGVTYSLPAPNRHHDVIKLILEKTGASHVYGEEQGFLLSDGKFARRKPALRVAIEAGQLKPDSLGAKLGKLFSEDVW